MGRVGSRFRAGFRLVVGAAILAVWAAACGSDDAESLRRGKLAEGCIINSDCNAPLVCAFRLCHQECKSQPDCDPGQLCVPADKPFNVCQLDSERECTHHSDCPAAFRCAADFKCRPECVTEKDCIAGQVCTDGVCAATEELVDGGLPTDASPDSGLGKPCVYNSNCPAPLVCISGSCLPECQEDRDCAFGLVCSAAKACVPGGGGDGGTDSGDAGGPGACANGTQDPGETGVDCGGPCGGCASDACTKPSDCASHVCSAKKCQAPSCTDGLQNGTESDIDCGGSSCSKCGPQKGCWGPLDCSAGNCTQGVCVDLSCSDKVKGGAETDVDCGGPLCSPCANGADCQVNGDCTSGNCVSKKCVPPGPTTWTEVYLNGAGGYRTTRIATDAAGSVIAAGRFQQGTLGGKLLSSAGIGDVYVAKYKPSGASDWAVHAASGAGDESVLGLGTDGAGDILIAGLTSQKATFGTKTLPCVGSTFYVAKLAGSNGANKWANCIEPGTGQLVATTAGIDSAGNVFVAGFFTGVHDFKVQQISDTGNAGFVAKFAAATGDPVKVVKFGLSYPSAPRAMVADGANMLMAGDFEYGDLTFGTATLTPTAGGGSDIFLVKVSTADLAFSSPVRFGGSLHDHVGGMARTAAGKLVLTGDFAGQVDFGTGPKSAKGGQDAFVMEVDPSSMTTTWANPFGSSADDRGEAVAVAPNGEIALAASVGAAADFGTGPLSYVGGVDLVVARYSSGGAPLGSKSWGGLGDDPPQAITWSGPFVALVGSHSSGLIDFGNGILSTNNVDMYIAHFAPP
ncbi:MAG: hypothetical protein IPM35_32125 [Myxococcales bacterium]|nr:hypothetical protein [Myxococcales bacterium]